MTNAAVEALRAYRAEESKRKIEAVQQAIPALAAEGAMVTKSAVARRAGVSRQFIHSHPSLVQAIDDAAREEKSGQATVRTPLAEGKRSDSKLLAARVESQRSTIADLRSRVAELERERQRWLGQQLSHHDAVDHQGHRDLLLAHDRLLEANTALEKEVGDLRRIVDVLEGDLRASRDAHAADMAAAGARDLPEVATLSAVRKQREPDSS